MSKKINKVQSEILSKRLEQNPKMSRGFVRQDRETVRKFWKQLALELNNAGPPEKNESEWKKAWNDQKRYERQKAPLNESIKRKIEESYRVQDFSPVEETIELFPIDADPLTHMSENEEQIQFYLNRVHLSLEQLCRQKQMELEEMKRHNLQIELLEQERIEQELTMKRRLLQLKEEKLKLLRQSMAKK